jgi:hypothetical protein
MDVTQELAIESQEGGNVHQQVSVTAEWIAFDIEKFAIRLVYEHMLSYSPYEPTCSHPCSPCNL